MNEDVLAILAFAVFGVAVVAFAWKRDKQNDRDHEHFNSRDNRRENFSYADISSTRNQAPKTQINYKVGYPQKGASYGELVDLKSRQLNNFEVKAQDPLEGILLERIETQFYEMRPLIGHDCVKTSAWTEYNIDLAEQTCTCDHFKKKEHFPTNDARRFCYHMIEAFERRDAFKRLDHRTRMVAELGSSAPIVSAFALQHDRLPLMYLLIEEENPWLNVFSRQKLTGENIHNASGDFVRHSYNILQDRWSYGESVPGASILKPFFRSLNTLEDIDIYETQIANRPKDLTLSQQSDPRLNPDRNSDQYGPEYDHYEIPESTLRSEYPCECSLWFFYIDGRGAESRRTVDFKKLQFYGSEGPFLYGECRMRKAGRTFNTKKMTEVINVATGEIVEQVAEYAESFWLESTKAKLIDWANNNERMAKAFLFLLRGNKRPSKSDYLALSSIFSEILDGAPVNADDIKYLYNEQDATTAVGFQRLVGGIIKHHPEQVEWFKVNFTRLANARSKPNFADQAAIDYVNQRIP